MSRPASPLFGYRSGFTAVHRAPVALKFAILLCVTIAVFALPWAFLVPVSALLCVFAIVGKVDIRGLRGAVKLLAIWVAFIGAFRLVGKPLDPGILSVELGETGLYAWRLAAVLLAGSVFYETTSGLEIRDSFARAEDMVNRAVRGLSGLIPYRRTEKAPKGVRFALVFSLTIIFIPRIFAAWESLERAWQARGGSQKGFRGAYRKVSVLLPLLLLRLFSLAVDTDRAIRNRSR